MSVLLLAAMIMTGAPAETAPQPPALQQPATAQQPAAKKQKPKQVCEMVEVTGSRSKRRVCRDDSGNLDLGPGIRSGSYGNGSDGQGSSSAGPGGAN